MSTEFSRPGKKFFSTPAHCEARKKSFFAACTLHGPKKKFFVLPAHCMARKKVFLQTKLTDNPKKITFFAFGK